MSDHPASPPTIRTPRLFLRPLTEGDRAEYVRAHADSRDHLAPWSPASRFGGNYDEAFTDELEKGALTESQGTGCRRVAELLDGALPDPSIAPGRRPLVAFVNLNNIVRGVFLNADMGWRVMREFTGRGLGTEAVVAMLSLAFAAPPRGLGLHRVQANILPTNEPSLRLAASAGFRREGVALKMLCIAGEWEDHVMHAKLADEHEAVYLKGE